MFGAKVVNRYWIAKKCDKGNEAIFTDTQNLSNFNIQNENECILLTDTILFPDNLLNFLSS